MTDPKRPIDPFANIVNLATDQKLFSSEPKPTSESTREVTQEPTQPRETSREVLRQSSRQTQRQEPRGKTRELKRVNLRHIPSRDAIQEFSFHLRDELKVKVQAEVPADWQKEFEDMAHRLDVGKLELYRYILGTFLGKLEPEDEPDES